MWMRNRAWLGLLVVFLLASILSVVVAGTVVSARSLILGMELQVPNAALIPAGVAVAYGYCLSRSDKVTESATIRPVRLADVGVALTLVVATANVGMLCESAWVTLMVARNQMGLLGIVLLVSGLGHPRQASLTAAAYVIFAILTGSQAHGAAPWAWLIKDGSDPIAAVLSLAVFVAGAVTYLRP